MKLDGKVAFITGAARGQGRSHAVRMAEEGADIIAVDICRPVLAAKPTATPEDLEETVRVVEATGRRIVASEVDVRDLPGLDAAVKDGVSKLGRLDTVVANAGVALEEKFRVEDIGEDEWRAIIDINLTGVWNTCKVAIPHLDAGASIVLISSVLGTKGAPHVAGYTASKHGVMGLMKSLAHELGPRKIRANCINPGQVDSPMIQDERLYRIFCPDIENPTRDDFAVVAANTSLMQIPWLDPIDISNVVLFLASEEARYVTGTAFAIDAGMVAK